MTTLTKQADASMFNLQTQGSRILIVEDEAVHRFLLQDLFEENGHTVVVAKNGKQALALIDKRKPDLILLDILMSEMDGFETCQHIKANQDTADIPVIFSTSLTESDHIAAGFKAGAADYLTKPFKAGEVLARANTQLKLQKAFAEILRFNQELEQILEKERNELIKVERQAAFSQLLQGIVHNFKGPLSVICGAVELEEDALVRVEKELQLGPKADIEFLCSVVKDSLKLMELLKRSTLNLRGMVEGLMLKSRQDQEVEPEVFDLNELVRKELQFLEADLIFKTKIVKDIDLSKETLPVKAVFSEVAQVFNNLIRNSIDSLYSRPKKQKSITIRTKVNSKFVYLTVQDSGCGIKKDDLEQIFDPFFSTKPKAGQEIDNEPVGTGLGLFMSRQVATKFGGGLKVESEFGTGTTIHLNLPLFC